MLAPERQYQQPDTYGGKPAASYSPPHQAPSLRSSLSALVHPLLTVSTSSSHCFHFGPSTLLPPSPTTSLRLQPES
ncbi:hypothetical protein INR49_017205 [Caranx melampygus]|nr:hypothetical protein INR49_017205 [Caranx melampygus]